MPNQFYNARSRWDPGTMENLCVTFNTCKILICFIPLETLPIWQYVQKNSNFWLKNCQIFSGHLTSRVFIYKFRKSSWKFRHSSRFVCFLQFKCIWPFLTNCAIQNGKIWKTNCKAIKSGFWIYIINLILAHFRYLK